MDMGVLSPPSTTRVSASPTAPRGIERKVLAWIWVLVVPFVVYALPYALATGRHLAGAAPATFTVDEPLYLGEAHALANGHPATYNPWTRRTGQEADAYRYFCGSLLLAAGWELLGGDATLGLALAAGLCAALASLFSRSILGRCLPGPSAASWILAPLVVMGPWDSLGQWARLDPDLRLLGAFLPLGRPFTSQWGSCLFLGALAVAPRLFERRTSRVVALAGLALVLQFFTFPYAVPLTLAVWTVAIALSKEGSIRERTWTPVALWGIAAGLSLGTLWLRLPASAEADLGLLVAPRFGGSGLLLLALCAVAIGRRSLFQPGARWVLPATAGAVLLGMLAGHVVPGRLHVIEHVAYLYGPTTALVSLGLLGAIRVRGRSPAAGVPGLLLANACLVLALACSVKTVEAHEPALADRAAWAEALRSVPSGNGARLLVEGEDIDGPGAWSAIESPVPVFYAYTSEYSTKVSLDDRRWRRAWYLHFRGLDAAEVRRAGASVVAKYPRFFGAHNTVPRLDVVESMASLLDRIERAEPVAVAFLAEGGSLYLLEDSRRPVFVRERIERVLSSSEETTDGRFRRTRYEPKPLSTPK